MRKWLLAIAMGLLFVGRAFGAGNGSSPTLCSTLRGDVCYLTSSELNEINNNPKSFKSVFLAHKREFISNLGPQFRGITEGGAALAFAGVVAYELKAYRSTTDSSNPAPTSRNMVDLMAVPRLVCDEYVSLATQLFYLAYPQSDSSPIKIYAVGWRRDSPVGNHAEFFVTGGGVPLLVDPDLGLIARTTLHDLLNHVAVAERAVFVRTNRPADATASLLLRERKALAGGAFDADFLIYSFAVRDLGQHDGPKYSYSWSDFTSSVAHGTDGRVWYTTGAGALYVVNQNGIERVQKTGVVDVEPAPHGDAIYALSKSGAVYRYLPHNIKTLVRAHGVDAIIYKANGSVLYLGAGDRLPSLGRSVYSRLNIVGAGTGLGGGDFKRSTDSGLKRVAYIDPALEGVPSTDGDVVWIAGKKGDPGCYIRTQSGELWSVDGTGAMTYLAAGIAAAQLGVGGLTINVLKSDGTVWQGNLDADGGRKGHRQPQPITWSEIWPGRRFASIQLSNGGATLEAVRPDGSHFVGSASTF